ncbi:diaminopimelate decarboxylase [Amycolatopsis acidiphila]|uniref:Diaminopimelate decarboxylase n=1 Tax=Amycolatopsis acidiphila TaxID=715473 RepID=A0A558A836_9PSEU|nr:diaminopimelate decarboxylase [Amycolatopsis acidiphila]TVT20408.1 diaminopimelate decarboxylase [Amycolatopsis acidiphila]UIJ59206.1 diaminopimelate decarboxylase [Amycolatopsis acidiphila]GHG79121.1 diaminopimelate decarboxylase [Amycolatopsis acidiphila]
MTLAELLPSVGACGEPPLEKHLWPASTRLLPQGDLEVGGQALTSLAGHFGTPLQLLDETEVRHRARAFRQALPEAEVVFAGKSLPCRSVFRWLADEELSLDVCSAGELAAARTAGIPAARILMHGNVKTDEDLEAALSYGVGRIVLDSFDEMDQLAGTAQPVLIRVTPGIDAHTHPAVTTGVDGQKFGFPLDTVPDAARQTAANGLRLVGLHCHLGSQITRVSVYEDAVRRLIGLGLPIEQLDLGGGFAAPYCVGDQPFDLTGFANRIRAALAHECTRQRIPLPRLVIEPGRAIVANAGVTLYRVIAVKPGFVAVDGGMSDNPRPALYGARYTARLVGRHTRAPRHAVTVVGRHCEAGDILAQDVPLPDDVHAGDLLAVPVTGAYHHALASNYNLVGRPPVVGVRDGVAQLLVRRETEEDLLRRDLIPA